MSIKQYPGGIITKNPTAPTTSSAKGIWTLDQAQQYTKQGIWPRSPGAPTIGTATAGSSSASVTFSAPSCVGTGSLTYSVKSTPGCITGTGASSPITVSGLANGTAYTFRAFGVTPGGTGPASAASNSVTPFIPVGQQAYTAVGTYSFVVPCGVTSVAAVTVGGGAYGYYEVGQTSSFGCYVQATGGRSALSGGSAGGQGTTISGCVGGGNGGAAGTSGCINNGGGGAGGYSGTGGRGGQYAGSFTSVPGNAGAGGGGGGGGANYYNGCSGTGGGGAGGVGLLGQGSNGSAGGANGGAGGGGSGGQNGEACGNVIGGRYGGGSAGGGGGGLRYRNNISVTPGSSISVTVGRAGNGCTCYGGRGAVRIIWPGTTRSFPSTCTGDL